MRSPAIAFSLALLCAALGGVPLSAQTGRWGNGSAITVPKGRWEFGIFAPLRFGLRDDLEISAQPLLMPVMPNVEAKALWYRGESFSFSMVYSLAYPTYLLKLVSREGAGGLLPQTTEVPQTVMAGSSFLGTVDLGGEQYVTASGGATVAPSFTSSDDMPLLDFPFLYARFAALKAIATCKLGLSYDGRIRWMAYAADFKYFILPVIDNGFAIEQGAWLGWLTGDHFTVRIGYRLSYGKYPAGYLFNYFPFLDILFGG